MAEISGSEAEVVSPPSTVAAPAGFAERLRLALGKVAVGEVALLAALLALCVSIRLLRLQPIEYYDDEVTRWHFVRQWFHGNEFQDAQWTHHMARFGLNVPVYFVQALFGRHASAYYVWPIASFALQMLITYAATKRLGGRAPAVMAAIFLSIFTGMDRGASQLLPDAFSGTAMILTCYLLFRYHDSSIEKRMPWLLGAGLAFVWAYEIKESNLLFLPGTAASVWLCRGRLRDGLWFCAVLFVAIALETAGFRLFTNYASRFAVVGEAHGDITSTFWNLFSRFTRLEPSWQMLFWMWVPAALWLLGARDRRMTAFVLVPAAFLLLLTFMVRGINPIVIWTRFYSRYFEPLAPFFVGGVALFVVAAVRTAWQRLEVPWLLPLPQRLARWGAPITVAICVLVGLAEYAAAEDLLTEHTLKEVRRFSSVTNDAYRRNLPIVQARAKAKEPEERRVRSLKAIYGIYLNDAEIATSSLAKNGRLPEILDAVRHTARYAYVLHDPRAYSNDDIEAWVKRGCAVELTERKKHPAAAPRVPSIVVRQREKLPARCRPPSR